MGGVTTGLDGGHRVAGSASSTAPGLVLLVARGSARGGLGGAEPVRVVQVDHVPPTRARRRRLGRTRPRTPALRATPRSCGACARAWVSRPTKSPRDVARKRWRAGSGSGGVRRGVLHGKWLGGGIAKRARRVRAAPTGLVRTTAVGRQAQAAAVPGAPRSADGGASSWASLPAPPSRPRQRRSSVPG